MSDTFLAGRRILLLGSNERAALSVCRSLGRRGADVEIIAFDPVRQPAELSRYCRRRHFLGSPVTDVAAFLYRLETHLKDNRYDAVFPINDVACELVYADYAKLASHTVIVGPDPEAYRQAVDKAKALELARQVGLHTPDGVLLAPGDNTAPAFALLENGPVFVKPVRSCLISDNFVNTFEVKKCLETAQLERKLAEDLPRLPVLVQRPVNGRGTGLNLLADAGRLVAVSMNRRLHEPVDGGGSSFRCNIPVSEENVDIARHIAAKLNWSGLMMVELKDDAGKLTIMEMNCRPWGSIETAIRAGVDFPALAVAQALGMDLPDALVRSDRPVRVRNLKNDLRWVVGQRHRWLSRSSPLIDWFAALPRALGGREHLDIEQSDDLLPALGQLNPVVVKTWRRGLLALRMTTARLARRHRFRRLHPDEPVLFLCQGNINRSAVAEILFRHAGFSKVLSAGVLPLQGRGISPAAARFLEEKGLDGSRHRSRNLKALKHDHRKDVHIVVFDFRTLAEVSATHPELQSRVVLFDDLGRRKTGEIADPHGASEDQYADCFRRIEATLQDQIS
ncbi:ATP-grasp domain-containing protein [uncultured Marivita sp.]|uniref:arsenate reductase/protein-tyrosine-phosphatase family protein n=1 Tax=uncultured Marivita sp. TaxID=888080 RepID=UPI002626E133|nr:ATP-grasp domain-containing protein [uncultured Marivita sp.]